MAMQWPMRPSEFLPAELSPLRAMFAVKPPCLCFATRGVVKLQIERNITHAAMTMCLTVSCVLHIMGPMFTRCAFAYALDVEIPTSCRSTLFRRSVFTWLALMLLHVCVCVCLVSRPEFCAPLRCGASFAVRLPLGLHFDHRVCALRAGCLCPIERFIVLLQECEKLGRPATTACDKCHRRCTNLHVPPCGRVFVRPISCVWRRSSRCERLCET